MVQDYSVYFDVLSNVRRYNGTLTYANNVKLIRSLPLNESQEIILLWLQSVEESSPVDFEMVRCAAWVCTSIPKLDDQIVAWIKRKPTELRFAIGLRFIAGYWGAGHIVSETCLEFLINAINNDLQRQSDVYAYALKALDIVADPVGSVRIKAEQRRALSGILLTHLTYLEEHRLHPDVAESIEKLKDFETRKYYAIFDRAKDMDVSVFKGHKLSEIVSALLKWLEVWTRPGWFDQERMWYAGRYMAYVSGNGIDQTVCEWMQENPSLERCAVAAAFLGGYWQAAEVVICQQCLDILRMVLLQFSAGTDAHKTVTEALAIAAKKQTAL